MDDVLAAIFARKHRITATELRRLDAEQRRRLRDLASGHRPSRDRARAIELLARAEPEVGQEVLAAVLADSDEDPLWRAAAASNLATAGGRAAEAALRRAIRRGESALVMHRVCLALAKIGTSASIPVLQDLARAAGPELALTASFAARLIAARDGVGGVALPLPAPERPQPSPGSAEIKATIRPAEPALVERIAEDIGVGAHGLRLASGAAFDVSCGRVRTALLLNADLLGERLLEEPWRRPCLVGVIARHAEEADSYSASRVILAAPGEDGRVVLTVHRGDGVETEIGFAYREGREGRFDLSSVRPTGSWISEIRGQVRDGAVGSIEIVSRRVRTAKRAPEPLAPGGLS